MTRIFFAMALALTVMSSVGCVTAGGGGGGATGALSGHASKVIGAEGGSLQLYQVTLTIPAGALAQATEITVDTRQPVLGELEGLTAAYEFGPAGLKFAAPAELQVALSQADSEAKLYRGESLSTPPAEVPGAKLSGSTIVGSIGGFSYYVAGKPKKAGTGQTPGIGVSFVYNGDTYSTNPVLTGQIKGFAYSLVDGAGVIDGESQGGHVWYGKNACVTFRTNGMGVMDNKGGTSTRLYHFPWVSIKPEPGLAVAPGIYGLELDEKPAGTSVLDPNYVRSAELRQFQWGVRLNEDGTPYKSYDGSYEYGLKFIDGPSAGQVVRANWDPKTEAPSASPSHTLYKFFTAEPVENHFCMFRESVSKNAANLGPQCLETKVAALGYWPAHTKKHCYAGGMMQGAYEIVMEDGVKLQAGTFKDNRPVDGWSCYDFKTGKISASGKFSNDGVHTGKWDFYDGGVLSTSVTFKGVLRLTEFGFYAAVVEGEYSKYDLFKGGTLQERGSLLEGKRSGWWYTFDGKYMTGAEEYDAATQIADGASTCFKLKDGSKKCVAHTYSWRKQRKGYDWSKCSTSDNMKHSFYDQTGKVTSEKCYDLLPPYDDPKPGPERKCGGVCKM